MSETLTYQAYIEYTIANGTTKLSESISILGYII